MFDSAYLCNTTSSSDMSNNLSWVCCAFHHDSPPLYFTRVMLHPKLNTCTHTQVILNDDSLLRNHVKLELTPHTFQLDPSIHQHDYSPPMCL